MSDMNEFQMLVKMLHDALEQNNELRAHNAELIDEVKDLNEQLDQANQMATPIDRDDLAEDCVRQFCTRDPSDGTINGKIPAIKEYRARTGEGLKEAKEAIERYQHLAPDKDDILF